ncbi:unnamed protein product [Trichogramma brassicae]|uniref:Uncharacterized protein n=1 Tax=Trichogramma brassicae TaxID=86971 RepID=A0A6H5J359_9HYME|nr:unnamed protein product [Trichogramma brassicae]
MSEISSLGWLTTWLTDPTPEQPAVGQPPATSPSGETSTTGANTQADRPSGSNDPAKEKPSSVPQARAGTPGEEAIRARREQACANMRVELRKLEEESREQKDEARRLIRKRKGAVEEAKKLRTEEEALRSSLQRLAKQRAELEETIRLTAGKIDFAIKHANHLDDEAAGARKFLAEQAQLGGKPAKPTQAKSASTTTSRPAMIAQIHGAIRREPPSAATPRAPRANQPPPQEPHPVVARRSSTPGRGPSCSREAEPIQRRGAEDLGGGAHHNTIYIHEEALIDSQRSLDELHINQPSVSSECEANANNIEIKNGMYESLKFNTIIMKEESSTVENLLDKPRFKGLASLTRVELAAKGDGQREQQVPESAHGDGKMSRSKSGSLLPLPTKIKSSPSMIATAITRNILGAPLGTTKDGPLPTLADFATGSVEEKWTRIEGLVKGLADFIESKGNLHKEIGWYTACLVQAVSAFK